MKYCSYCGAELVDGQCPNCNGMPSTTTVVNSQRNNYVTVAKVFLILACVLLGMFIIPLAWCIPMTVHLFKKLNQNQSVSTETKVCTTLFVSLVAGIMLFLMDNE